MEKKTMNTNQIIYEMLTENTGMHMLDSGGASGRHWQRNQNKTIQEFEKEDVYKVIDKDSDYPYLVKSLYHHLVDSCEYLEQETNDFIKWVNEDQYDWANNPNGRCASSLCDIEEYMSLNYGDDTRIEYTYNYNNNLSQDIQFISIGDTYDCDIVALSIHNGADARGGFTDYKIFKIDHDLFHYIYESYEDYLEWSGKVA